MHAFFKKEKKKDSSHSTDVFDLLVMTKVKKRKRKNLTKHNKTNPH